VTQIAGEADVAVKTSIDVKAKEVALALGGIAEAAQMMKAHAVATQRASKRLVDGIDTLAEPHRLGVAV